MEEWLEAERLQVSDAITDQEARDILKRLEARNYVGRVFEISQRNCRQLQLDIEAALALCRYFIETRGSAD